MKTVFFLAALVALAASSAVPQQSWIRVETKSVDADFVLRQKKVLSLIQNVDQVFFDAEYYKIGQAYDIEANINMYSNKAAVEEFLTLYRTGFMPKYKVFSVFYERMREEAIALFKLFYYAKDFETFYKTAAFARVYLNEGQFLYAYYIAVFQREDLQGIVLPALYEVCPYLYTNADALNKAYAVKMSQGLANPSYAEQYGIKYEQDNYIFYSNYSSSMTYGNEESRLAYFTEDIGLNSFYSYFHAYFPFWMQGSEFGVIKERRGEIIYYFYQQLLARYYMERLTNGLGEIPEISWWLPIKTGYTPSLSSYYPFIQRNDYYYMQTPENVKYLQFLDSYERNFLQFLEQGHFKAYNQEIDFHNSKAINFVGNYWQNTADLYEKTGPRNYQYSYQEIARRLLSATPEPIDKYSIAPSALELYQTSLRDPVFYQFYKRMLNYFLEYKQYLEPYTQDYLHYVGVKINDVTVDKLVTYFDFFDYDVTNALYLTPEEYKTTSQRYKVRQPRLNHKPFTVTIDVKSDIAADSIVKIFMGPKYDSNGYPISLEDNWNNFVELDWFVYKLTQGQNKIERHSNEFFYFKEDSVPTTELYKLLEQGKVPKDMSENFDSFPNRLMLPKGTAGGFPFQFYVIVYPYQALGKEYEPFKSFILDGRPFGYPLDRPVNEAYFIQPNMYFEDVLIYHEGEQLTYKYNIPGYSVSQNEVPKH